MRLIDTHTHLDFNQFDVDRDKVVQRALENDVQAMITIGIDLKTSRQSVVLAESYDPVFAAVGVHPHDAGEVTVEELDEFDELLQHPKVVAVGEIGLDYYRNLTKPDIQRKILRHFLDVAKHHEKPVIVHTREAGDEILDIISAKAKSGWSGVFHCFAGDVDMAKRVMDLGFHISFTGNVTFKRNKAIDVAKEIPLDRLMVETDCPFLAPVPKRGKRNEPAYVHYVAQAIAEAKNISFDEFAQATTQNAINLFDLDI